MRPGLWEVRRRPLDDPEHPQEDQDQQYEGYDADDVLGTAQLEPPLGTTVLVKVILHR